MNSKAIQETPSTTMEQAINSVAFDIGDMRSFALIAKWTDDAPSAAVHASATDVTNATNTLSKVAHGFKTGLKVLASTSNTLPNGLSTTNYWVIRTDDDNYKLATSLVLANAGTVETFSDDGTGNQTFTPVAIAGSLALQYTTIPKSPTSGDWELISAQALSVGNPLGWAQSDHAATFVRAVYTPTAGTGPMTFMWSAKGG